MVPLLLPQAKVQGWLAKRARAGAATDDEEDEGEEDGGEGDRLNANGSGGAGSTRVKLSVTAARVRARLASEYEAGSARRQPDAGMRQLWVWVHPPVLVAILAILAFVIP